MVKITKPEPDISGKEHHAKEALKEEIGAAIRQKAEGWERTFKALAEQAAKGGRCTCEEKQGARASELQHDNFDCPVAIYLKMGRLVIEDLEKD
jgi:hypothetical protein